MSGQLSDKGSLRVWGIRSPEMSAGEGTWFCMPAEPQLSHGTLSPARKGLIVTQAGHCIWETILRVWDCLHLLSPRARVQISGTT